MENENKKSAAELARDERKSRIEKASKAKEEKKEKIANQSAAKKRAKVIVPIVACVLALTLGLCDYFGVPHRALTAVKLSNGTKISVAEYQYYYQSIYTYYLETALQYEQYYGSIYGEGAGKMMTGFDYSKTPANQEYTVKEGDEPLDKKYGENPTWADFFEQTAVETCQTNNALYDAAKKAGYKLSDEDKKKINDYIEQIRETAAENNYSLHAYLMENFGRGMTESLMRKILEQQMIVSGFMEDKQAEFEDGITNEEIMAKYNASPNEYNQVSVRAFTMYSEVAENTEGTKYTDEQLAEMTKKSANEIVAKADEFMSKATNENFTSLTAEYADEAEKSTYENNDAASTAANLTYSQVSQYFGEDGAKWAYDKARNVGDKTVVKVENEDGTVTCNILLMTSLPQRDDTKQPISVRHILFALEKTETDSTTGEQKKTPLRTKEEAQKLAQDTLDQWVKDGASEDKFIELAGTQSDDAGSSDNGGLYENVSKSSNYVEPFLNWCFAEGRKVGDYGIVETEYGYHIMYMSDISDSTEWEANIRSGLAEEKYTEYYNSVADDEHYNASLSNWLAKRVRNAMEDFGANVINNINKQMNASSDNTADSKN